MNDKVACPSPNCDFNGTVLRLIVHLNDIHYWTREGIADFVKTVEETVEVELEEETAEVAV